MIRKYLCPNTKFIAVNRMSDDNCTTPAVDNSEKNYEILKSKITELFFKNQCNPF